MNSSLRAIGVACAVSSLAFGLTGCTPSDAASARLVDNDLVFTFCQAIQAGRIEALVGVEDGDASSYASIWQSDGEGVFSAGDEIILGQDPEGFQTSITFTGFPESQPDEARIVFFVSDLDFEDASEGGIGANFLLDQLSSDYWLHEGGRRSNEACD